MEQIRKVRNVTISIYEDQYEYMKKNNINISIAYRESWDEVFLNKDKLLEEKEELERRLKEINNKMSEEREKPFTLEERTFLRQSNINVPEQQILFRYSIFKKTFNRFAITLDEFKEEVLNHQFKYSKI